MVALILLRVVGGKVNIVLEGVGCGRICGIDEQGARRSALQLVLREEVMEYIEN
jgi:hypothetical protein